MWPRCIFRLRPKVGALACAMLRRWSVLLSVSLSLLLFLTVASRSASSHWQTKFAVPAVSNLTQRETRTSPLDLEIGGDLAGLPSGTVRYLTREDLLKLPQISYTVTNDANFTAPAQASGVLLEELVKHLSANPQSELVVAICDDLYRANYPRGYIAAHHPVLVLTINGKPPEGWPKDPEGQGLDMGPYLISHPDFTSNSKVLSHTDEPQIPWGVVRLEFRNEKKVLGAIAPRGAHAEDSSVQDGYRIAQQNCFRCHNLGPEGGQKAGHPWLVLAAWATAAPEYFSAYVHDPRSKNPHAQMPGNPNYDDATIQALISYFRTFLNPEKP
jgi:mono/diheme cytochrome c family protein